MKYTSKSRHCLEIGQCSIHCDILKFQAGGTVKFGFKLTAR